MKKKVVLLTILITLTLTLTSYAAIPKMINFQGRAIDKTTSLPLQGNFNITFSIYDLPSGGTPLWTENWTQTTAQVQIANGVFSAALGTHVPINLPFDRQYYLGVKIGDDPEMVPRTPLASVGYAYMAEHAVTADSLTQRAIPQGVIVMWSGTIANIPIGWALCDGTNGTPDLRNKFIVGAKQDDVGTSKTDITGTLTKEGGQVTHTHTYSGRTGTPAHQGGGNTDYLPATDEHTHSYSGTTDSSSSLPPYYALAYIMKL